MINTIISKFPKDSSIYIYKKIEEDLKQGKKAILLVPEQYTLETDINFMKNISYKSVMDAKILSFSSLKSFITDKIGESDKQFLSKNAKLLLITNILQDKNDDLTLFKNNYNNIDFVNNICALISSIKDNNFDEDFFKDVEGSDDPVTKIKFKEIKMIYDEYEKEIADKFIDSEDNLSYIIEKLPECDFLDGVNFYFDKFDSLSELKLSFVDALLKRGNQVSISLNMDKTYLYDRRLNDLEIFDSSINLYYKLRELDQTKDLVLDDTKNLDDLSHLVDNFERYNYKKYNKAPAHIRFIENTSTKTEVETCAQLINYMVKKEGYRYRDIGIYISDEDEYKNEIEKVFNRYDLPVFMDSGRKLSDNHIIKTFLAILRLAIYNFSQDDLNYFLRSGLFSFAEDFDKKIIVFQNFIRNRKIKGKMFIDDKYFILDKEFYENLYENDPKSEEKLTEKILEYEIVNELRERILKLISPILSLNDEKTITIAKAIFDVLNDEDIRSGINKYQQILKSTGKLDDFKENDQVWDKFVEILEDLVALMGERESNLRKIYGLIEATCRDINVGIIPPSKDHIIVTSFSRARISDRGINFALGLNDVFFPSGSSADMIVGKNEKDKLKDLNLDLKAMDEDLDEREKLNLYRLITISDRIFFSYSLSNRKSEAINKSVVLNSIMNIFRDGKGKMYPESMIYGNNLNLSIEKYSFEKIGKYALENIRKIKKNEKIDPDAYDISKFFIKYLKDNDDFDLIRKGLTYSNDKEKLSKELSSKLYKKNHFNVSEIERYSRCPYQYFVNYGLRPNIEDSYDVDHLEVGNIVHKLLEDISKVLKDTDIETIDPKNLEEILIENFRLATEKNLDQTRRVDPRNKFILNNILKSGKRNTDKLIDQVKKGDFEVYAVEKDFGYKNRESLPEVYIDGENYLRGRIDRIDKSDDFVRIIDYKTGNKEFKIVNLLNGLDLQLLVYMMAASLNDKEIMVPIGSFYMPLADEITTLKEGYSKEAIESSTLDKFRINGLIIKINEEIFRLIDKDSDSLKDSSIIDMKKSDILDPIQAEKLQEFAKNLVAKYIRNIKDGDIKLNPLSYGKDRNECQWCDYKGICKFDPTIDQLRFRQFDDNLSLKDLGGEVDV